MTTATTSRLTKTEKHILSVTWYDFLVIRYDAHGAVIAAEVSRKPVHLLSAESLIARNLIQVISETNRLVGGRKERWVSHALTAAGRIAK
jgi:hypothetical protein